MSFNMSELGLGSFDIPFTFKLRLVFIDYYSVHDKNR